MKISVIVPVYNAENYINSFASSMMNQRFKDFEVVFINDASTDKTQLLIDNLINKNSYFRCIKNDHNCGAPYSRNVGLAKAKGEYIIFLDVDDIYSNDLLYILFNAIENTNSEVAVCKSLIVDKNTNRTRVFGQWKRLATLFTAKTYVIDNVSSCEGIVSLIDLPAWDKLIKREFLLNNNIQFQLLTAFNDVFFSLASCLLANRIVFVNESLITYIMYNNSSISSKHKNHYDNIIKAYDKVLDYEQIQNSKIASEFINRAIHNVLFLANKDTEDIEYKNETLLELYSVYSIKWKKLSCKLDPICEVCLKVIGKENNAIKEFNTDYLSAQLIIDRFVETKEICIFTNDCSKYESLKKILINSGKQIIFKDNNKCDDCFTCEGKEYDLREFFI